MENIHGGHDRPEDWDDDRSDSAGSPGEYDASIKDGSAEISAPEEDNSYGVVIIGGGDVVYGNNITQSNVFYAEPPYPDGEQETAYTWGDQEDVFTDPSGGRSMGVEVSMFYDQDGGRFLSDSLGGMAYFSPGDDYTRTRVIRFDDKGNSIVEEVEGPVILPIDPNREVPPETTEDKDR